MIEESLGGVAGPHPAAVRRAIPSADKFVAKRTNCSFAIITRPPSLIARPSIPLSNLDMAKLRKQNDELWRAILRMTGSRRSVRFDHRLQLADRRRMRLPRPGRSIVQPRPIESRHRSPPPPGNPRRLPIPA